MKSTLVKKKIGYKTYREVIQERKVKIITEPEYETEGESVLIVKETPLCNLTLNSLTTSSIKIKAMTRVLIVPKNSTIDDLYEEMVIEKGACVELEFFENSWFILSSDGVKLD